MTEALTDMAKAMSTATSIAQMREAAKEFSLQQKVRNNCGYTKDKRFQ